MGESQSFSRITGILPVLLLCVTASAAEKPFIVEIDCAKITGEIRALHGVNNGPLDAGGTIDLSADHRALRLPLVRLHDAHWPNPDVVDMHAVFPDFTKDPAEPKSYDFARTDEYIDAILKTGAKIVYRLGQSIEHGKDKRRVAPPKDVEKWAQVCLGIIRHYKPRGIEYWEIWNEPENRPQMWTGNDQDYYRLYVTVAKAIKREFPNLKVGGPSAGHWGKMEGENPEPTPFIAGLLKRCKDENAPIDFFSWHKYSDDPAAFARPARGIRKVLDAAGFPKAEIHLNEWNYLPRDDWNPVIKTQGKVRDDFYKEMTGEAGAAFVAMALTTLQDSPLTHGNFYAGDTNPFGLFTRHGAPNKNYFGMKAFAMMLETPIRIDDQPAERDRISVLAGMSRAKDEVRILVSNFDCTKDRVEMTLANRPWAGKTHVTVRSVDQDNDLAESEKLELRDGRLELSLPAAGVKLLTFKPAK